MRQNLDFRIRIINEKACNLPCSDYSNRTGSPTTHHHLFLREGTPLKKFSKKH